MRNKMKTKIITLALVTALTSGGLFYSAPVSKTAAAEDNVPIVSDEPITTPTAKPTVKPTKKPSPKPTKKPTKKPAIKYTWDGYFYFAKGEPRTFILSKKAKLISLTGGKYKKTGKKIVFTARKNGKIKYKVGNKYKYQTINVGGNNCIRTKDNTIRTKDKKLNVKEYNYNIKYKNKKYKNFISFVRSNPNTGWTYTTDSKSDINHDSKYNRGMKYGDFSSKLLRKYASWEDDSATENYYESIITARYYDKKSKQVVYKYFHFNKKQKLVKVEWISYISKKASPIKIR